MSTIPDYVYLMCTIKGATFTEAFERLFTAFDQAGLPQVEAWSMPSREAKQKGTTVQAREQVVAHGAGKEPPTNGIFYMAAEVTATIYERKDSGPGCYGLRMSKVVGDERHGEMLGFIAQACGVCRYLLQHGGLEQVSLFREGGGLACVPTVPLVDTTSHLALATQQQVGETYDNPQAFWEAGWDASESYGDQQLLLRGLDILEGPDYLAKIQPHQWAMARAAKPGLTEYYLPQLEPEEEDIYRSGSAVLDIVGHLAGENLIEYSCAAEPGQHIQGWEIIDILGLLEQGELPDGRQVEVVRVVFLECASAQEEKRPLLDVGAKVYCYDDAGELIEIPE